jgi:hypothetical protein
MEDFSPSVPRTAHTVCGLCRNSSNTKEPTQVSVCGVCVYHTECARGLRACECGFPYSNLLSIGASCMACRKRIPSGLFCRHHLDEAINQLKLYSTRGVDCRPKHLGMCTPFSVLKTNGLLQQKLDGDIWKEYMLKFALNLPKKFPEVFVMHNNTLLTLASRLKMHIDAKLKTLQLDVFELASEIFDSEERVNLAVKMLKETYPKLPVNHQGKILPKGLAKGINSVVSNVPKIIV